MTHAERFLADIEAFLIRSGMTATAFGTAALNDPSFVPDLRNGRKPNLGLVDRVHTFIEAHDSPPQAPEQGGEDQHPHANDGAAADSVDAHEVTS